MSHLDTNAVVSFLSFFVSNFEAMFLIKQSTDLVFTIPIHCDIVHHFTAPLVSVDGGCGPVPEE